MVKFKIGDLFSAPPGSYLLHACNCMGVWGSGVALEFKKRFPKSFIEYKDFCKDVHPGDLLVCQEENGYRVICLFSSKGYGATVDSPEQIIEATKVALTKLPGDSPINMPLINSGRFNVPWEQTASLLRNYDDLDITVWSLK